MAVVVKHNAGFFSCCNIRLWDIITFINTNKGLPLKVDSSQQFQWYKTINRDVTFDYFKNYEKIDIPCKLSYPIDYHHDYQFSDYSTLQYKNIVPLIHKYFTPSDEVYTYMNQIEQKYSMDFENTCVLFYRGNDKNRETSICNYDEYVEYAHKVLAKNPNTVFLIQSDETEFIQMFQSLFPTSFYFKDEIRHMKKCDSTVDLTMRQNIELFSKYYLAITVIMAKCKYIVCGTGNCSLWIMFYRGNNKNVFQNKDGKWIES